MCALAQKHDRMPRNNKKRQGSTGYLPFRSSSTYPAHFQTLAIDVATGVGGWLSPDPMPIGWGVEGEIATANFRELHTCELLRTSYTAAVKSIDPATIVDLDGIGPF